MHWTRPMASMTPGETGSPAIAGDVANANARMVKQTWAVRLWRAGATIAFIGVFLRKQTSEIPTLPVPWRAGQ